MVDIFYYIPKQDIRDAIDGGIKLSEKYDKEVIINNESKQCLVGYLNPKDNSDKLLSDNYSCARARIPKRNVFIGDSALYEIGSLNEDAMKIYNSMIIPVSEYIFGTFRNPECLITTSLLGDSLTLIDENIDVPILVEDTVELYLEKVTMEMSDSYKTFKNDMLYTYLAWLVSEGKADVLYAENIRHDAFIIKESGRCIVLKRPDIEGTNNIEE
jgi:hypothetical protein